VGDGGANAGHLIGADGHADAGAADEQPTAGVPARHRLRDSEPDMRIGSIIGRIGDAQVDDVNPWVRLELFSERVLHRGAGIVGPDREDIAGMSFMGHGSCSSVWRYPSGTSCQWWARAWYPLTGTEGTVPEICDDAGMAPGIDWTGLEVQRERPTVDRDTLSIGMSDNVRVAIEKGATTVRIGCALFGHLAEQPSA
jgi:hypothetical protein